MDKVSLIQNKTKIFLTFHFQNLGISRILFQMSKKQYHKHKILKLKTRMKMLAMIKRKEKERRENQNDQFKIKITKLVKLNRIHQ